MRAGALAAALALAPAAFAQSGPEAIAVYGAEAPTSEILVRGALDISSFGPAIESFVAVRPGMRVTLEQWNSNELYLLAEAACRGATASADLVISSSVDQQVKLVNDGCAQPYSSTATAALPDDRNWRDELFGLTYEPAVIVYNRALLAPEDAPASRFDLLDLLRREEERLRGRVATYDIERSGIGYLFAFLNSVEATTFGSLIEAFGRTGAVATCCSAEIVDAVARGDFLVAYNVLGSYALVRAAEDDALAVVTPRDYTLMLSRAAFIPRDAPRPEAAGALIDFLLSAAGRRALARTFLISETGAPDAAVDPNVRRPVPLSPVLLVGLDRQKRERLLALWRQTFPR